MKGTWKRLFALILVMAILAITPSCALAASIPAKVTHDGLPVFILPVFAKEACIGALPKGTEVDVTAISGVWARITLCGKTCYTGVNYLTPVSAAPSNPTVRLKGYTVCDTPLYKSASTSSQVLGTLSFATEVYAIGASGDFFCVQNASGSITGFVLQSTLSRSKPSSSPSVEQVFAAMRASTVKLDWYNGGSNVVSRGGYFYIYDILSSQVIRVKRSGGTNHMDIEPANSSETAKLKSAYGGSWSWDSHPVILISGTTCVAAAINGMPHDGNDTLNNGMDGVICLHLSNSRTHGSDAVNENHQEAIDWAYQWAHS